jgi:Gly-Xaa carboxypeptidase
MSSIESLLESKFEPARTVVLSFGFDEEASGIYVRHTYSYNLKRSSIPFTPQGASSLAKYLLESYGEDAFALLIDEGGWLPVYLYQNGHTLNHLSYPAGFGEQFGGVFATPGIAEKGYTDVRVEVTSPGGHSSVPPPHTVRCHFCDKT